MLQTYSTRHPSLGLPSGQHAAIMNAPSTYIHMIPTLFDQIRSHVSNYLSMVNKMLIFLRARSTQALPLLQASATLQRPFATRDRTSDRLPTNDPLPPKPAQNVSESNAVPISPQGLRDEEIPLQEMPEDSERQRVMQAPNRQDPWSRSQQPRERAMSGPRFEQTIMEYQVDTSYTLGLQTAQSTCTL